MGLTDRLQLETIGFTKDAKSCLHINRLSSRVYSASFGVTPYITAWIWIKIIDEGLLPKKGKRKHLLWTLYWMKTYLTNDVLCAALQIGSDKTFCKWRDEFIWAIANIDVVRMSRHRRRHSPYFYYYSCSSLFVYYSLSIYYRSALETD